MEEPEISLPQTPAPKAKRSWAKRLLRAMLFFFGFLVVLLLGVYAAFRSTKVQTQVTQYLARELSKKLKTKVSIEGVDIALFNKVILEGVYVEDLKHDTLAYIGELKAGLKDLDLKKHYLDVSKVTLTDLNFYLRHYKGDEDLNLQFIIDALASSDTTIDTTASPRWVLDFDGLKINNGAFKFNDFRKERFTPGMEFTFLDLKGIQLDFDSVNISGDTISAIVNNLSARDKCGFNLQQLSGRGSISSSFLHLENVRLQTPFSKLDLDLDFKYREWNDWEDFVDSVKIIADLRPSHLNFIDIGFFARPLFRLDIPLELQGKIKGPVSNLKAKNLTIHYGKSTYLNGNFDIAGLPNLEETFFTLNFKEFTSNRQDIITIPTPPYTEAGFVPVPDLFDKFGQIKFAGNFTGYYYDFVAYGQFKTGIGNLKTDLSMKNVSNSKECTYSGKVFAEHFDLGAIANNKDLIGTITANITADGKGLTAESLDANIKANIAELGFKQYVYKQIELDGQFFHKIFKGGIVTHDENLKMTFNGSVDLTDTIPDFDFHAELGRANLDKLNLFKIDSAISVTCGIDVNFKGNTIDNAIGEAGLYNIRYIQNKDTVLVNKLETRIQKTQNDKLITLRSDVADADFRGNFTFADIPEAVNHLMIQYLPRFAGKFKNLDQPLDIDVDLTLKNTKLLEVMFVPTLHIAKGGNIKAGYNSTTENVKIKGTLPLFYIGENFFEYIDITGKNLNNSLDLDIGIKRFVFGDSVWIENIALYSLTRNDTMNFDLGWKNNEGMKNSGDIKGAWGFANGKKIQLDLKASEIFLADSLWKINPMCQVEIDSNAIGLKNLIFKSRTQELSINGKISENPDDKLSLIIKDFELSNLNALTKNANIAFSGFINGRADLADVYKQLIVTADIGVQLLEINKERVGNGQIRSVYDNLNKALRLDAKFTRDDIKTFAINGFYYPEKKVNALNFDLNLEQLPLKVAEAFTKNIFSNISGNLSGNVNVGGVLKKIETEGKVRLNKARLTIDYLNTSYAIDDEVKITSQAFEFSDIRIKDAKGNEGVLSGKIIHKHFSDIRFELNILANKLMALNTNEMQNSMYFGKAFVTGLLKMRGGLKNISFDAAMKTEKGTQFNIPLGSTGETSTADFVKFINRKDTTLKLKRASRIDNSKMDVNLKITATPDAEVKIIFDEKVGDIITARGNGEISLNIDTKGTFQMFGEYAVESGGYLFTLQNLVNKQFKVDKGGTIKWSGSPYDAELNIVANYTSKASVYELLQEERYKTGAYRVDCKMNMTGRLLNPTINFDINLPNASSEMQTNVTNAIPNEDKNKQVFGLLVLNKFFPSSTGTTQANAPANATSGTTSSNSLANSTSELISSQLSNMLSQISKDFNLGVKYRPGDQLTSQELQVMVSTQLFNNRITVDGAFGYQQNNGSSSSSQTNILGDVNVEYKITNDGRIRAKAFNKTNDMNLISSNSAPYTQGMGVSLRREFDTMGDLFRSFLRKKEKKKPSI